MSQSEKFNPTSISNLVRDRIDKKSRGEFVQVKPPSPGAGKFAFSSSAGGASSAAQDDLVTEFTANLLGQPSSPKTNDAQGRFNSNRRGAQTGAANPNQGVSGRTNPSLELLNKQEVSNSTSPVGMAELNPRNDERDVEQTFLLETDYAGPVEVCVKRKAKANGIELVLNLQKNLTLKGQDVLAQLLKTQLGNNLDLPVEVKINCLGNPCQGKAEKI